MNARQSFKVHADALVRIIRANVSDRYCEPALVALRKALGDVALHLINHPKKMIEDQAPASAVVTPAHYSRFPIEPIRFIEENRLSPLQGKVVKYVCRYDMKNGLEDLYKALRCLELLIRKTEKHPSWWEAGPVAGYPKEAKDVPIGA